jgi:hypothetical protein
MPRSPHGGRGIRVSHQVGRCARELVPADGVWHHANVTNFVVIIIDERAG